MFELTILGTTAGAPTKERGHSAIALKHEGKVYLFDCGENAQRQARIAGISLFKINAIFITHWHADHFAGLIGIIQTMALLERKEPLYIYGPKPAKIIIETLRKLDEYAHFAGPIHLGYDLIVKEIESGLVYSGENCIIEAIPSIHSVSGVSYKFSEKDKPGKFNVKKAKQLGLKPVQFGELQRGNNVKVENKVVKPSDVMGAPRPGLKIVYSGDTAYNSEMVKFASEVDLLIHEATYTSELSDQAKEVGHTTAKEAAEIAKKAKVKNLLLTHFSSRYKDTKVFSQEARKIFKNTEVAKDLMKITLK
ncbi:TPA: ribonuclease Z [archaeon]|uniref:Ribonuclease Z n=1 Tax=Candidatus Naiadarchaeum limnaeum TaxID=2756139 RepID=A0A832UPG1_9ARCH|nr:ribonuclease Z [Candidatus Naiadarchaeum limnaeum]